MGTLKEYKEHLTLEEGATPRFLKSRQVPFALKTVIEKELEKLTRLGIIERIGRCKWAAPLVAVPKPDGCIRLCGDYKVTVNPSLKVDVHPLPNSEDLFATLLGDVMFSKLDPAHAYQQVLLDEESRKFVTVITHRGLFQYTRLPFGILSATAIFQEIMDKLLQGIANIACYFDDTLISGSSVKEHNEMLEKVLDRLMSHGLRLKKKRCSFMMSEVDYLGQKISVAGLETTDSKVASVL